jgi:polyvinyl alcohol dehydrogenase (cytochrome)
MVTPRLSAGPCLTFSLLNFNCMIRIYLLIFMSVCAATSAAQLASAQKDSAAIKIFISACATCHKETGQALAPGTAVLASMTPRAIYASLTHGKMRAQGEQLSDDQRQLIAEWITKSKLKETPLPPATFTKFDLSRNNRAADHSGWGNSAEGTGFLTTEQAGISAKNVGALKLKWAFAFPDGSVIRSKPAVVGDWLVAGSQYGQVYAINQQTGKVGWEFNASSAIRGAITIVRLESKTMAVFADFSTNVYAIDVLTGKQIWNVRAGFEAFSATTGSVAVYKNKLFVPISSVEVSAAFSNNYDCCISSGGIVALDVRTGAILWTYRILPQATAGTLKKNGKPSYGPSGAPVWSSPTIDAKRGLLYIGTGQNYSDPASNTSDAVQAINMESGKLVWNFQPTTNDAYNLACPVFLNCPPSNGPDLDFGMAPILVKSGKFGDILVAGQKSGVVYALTPAGKLIWKTRVGKGGKLGGIHWGMATDGTNVYAANSDNAIALDNTDSAIKASPGVYAIALATGKVVWSAPSVPCTNKGLCLNGNSAAPLVLPGVVFAGSLDGHMRAYSTIDGTILWDFDTVKDFETTTGLPGKGGAIDGPAPVAAAGMLFVNSGYGMFGQRPGNVLLAFATENGK